MDRVSHSVRQAMHSTTALASLTKAPPERFDLWPITHPLYVVFTAKTKDDIGKTWKRIMEAFFPNNAYDMADAADFEIYRHEPTDYFCEIWVPIIET